MAKINMSDIAKKLADEMGLSEKAAKSYTAFVFESLKDYAERGDEINIPMLGKFKMIVTAPRKGRNIYTKERIDIPARHRISFSMSRKLQHIYDEADRQDAGGGKED